MVPGSFRAGRLRPRTADATKSFYAAQFHRINNLCWPSQWSSRGSTGRNRYSEAAVIEAMGRGILDAFPSGHDGLCRAMDCFAAPVITTRAQLRSSSLRERNCIRRWARIRAIRWLAMMETNSGAYR
jgi:hypothetical protein